MFQLSTIPKFLSALLVVGSQESLRLANELRAYCREHYKKDYYLQVSIHGIGGYTTSAVLADVRDLRRFTETEFASYVGIIPMMRNSGATENQS
jgi:transposase